MTDIEKELNLPEPIKVKASIAKYLDKLDEKGKTLLEILQSLKK